MTPVASVILPARNAERHLRQCLESVVCQTFSSYEIVFVDDGSVDETSEIVRTYALRDRRFLVINGAGEGLGKALNLGIAHARGRYIVRMDADDVMCPERIAKQVDFLDANPNLAGVTCAWENVGRVGRRPTVPFPSNVCEAGRLLLLENWICHPGVAVRRRLFADGLFRYGDGAVEDYVLWCNMFASGHEIGALSEVLLRYRIHPAQMSHGTNSDNGRAAIERGLVSIIRSFGLTAGVDVYSRIYRPDWYVAVEFQRFREYSEAIVAAGFARFGKALRMFAARRMASVFAGAGRAAVVPYLRWAENDLRLSVREVSSFVPALLVDRELARRTGERLRWLRRLV